MLRLHAATRGPLLAANLNRDEPVDRNSALAELQITAWDGPFPADDQARTATALETGHVVVLPLLPFTLDAGEDRFCAPDTASGARKNISFDPATGRCHGTDTEGEERTALSAMIDRFGRAAETLVRGLVPAYAASLQRARTSFRPVEISGRATSPRHDDRRLHVDAFPSRPLRGRRILRVFSNIAPDGTAREWRVGEPFTDMAQRFLPKLRPLLPGQAWAMATLGLTKGSRSAYDQAMLGLHDTAKMDEAYQKDSPQLGVSFPPGTTWMCFTDQVMHAAMAGRFALEQTFYLPATAMTLPSRSPLRTLEQLTGRAMV
jgi:hypothetical protein